jgi:hypothetical protein
MVTGLKDVNARDKFKFGPPFGRIRVRGHDDVIEPHSGG